MLVNRHALKSSQCIFESSGISKSSRDSSQLIVHRSQDLSQRHSREIESVPLECHGQKDEILTCFEAVNMERYERGFAPLKNRSRTQTVGCQSEYSPMPTEATSTE